jgi:hypothetical protein
VLNIEPPSVDLRLATRGVSDTHVMSAALRRVEDPHATLGIIAVHRRKIAAPRYQYSSSTMDDATLSTTRLRWRLTSSFQGM